VPRATFGEKAIIFQVFVVVVVAESSTVCILQYVINRGRRIQTNCYIISNENTYFAIKGIRYEDKNLLERNKKKIKEYEKSSYFSLSPDTK
jgi:hypothetical protein